MAVGTISSMRRNACRTVRGGEMAYERTASVTRRLNVKRAEESSDLVSDNKPAPLIRRYHTILGPLTLTPLGTNLKKKRPQHSPLWI